MVKVNELNINDELIYDDKFTVVYLGVEGDKVIVKDPVVGQLKILKEIFEAHYSLK